MKTKVCTGECARELPETEEYFSFRKDSNKFRNECKECINNKRKEKRLSFPWIHRFQNIKGRIINPKDSHYKYYGGKGIKLKLTADDIKFLWFRDDADKMKHPSIDRIDNDGDYAVENCRFIEMSENTAKDKRKPILQYDLAGNFIREYSSQYEAAKKLNIHVMAIHKALYKITKTSGGYKWKYKNEKN